MIVVRTAESAEEALADGMMRCHRGYGGPSQGGDTAAADACAPSVHPIDVRPRRVRCRGCGTTQVLLPATVQPRRADTTEVVGTTLVARPQASATGGSLPTCPEDQRPATIPIHHKQCLW
jgi:hypothetical protein